MAMALGGVAIAKSGGTGEILAALNNVTKTKVD